VSNRTVSPAAAEMAKGARASMIKKQIRDITISQGQ